MAYFVRISVGGLLACVDAYRRVGMRIELIVFAGLWPCHVVASSGRSGSLGAQTCSPPALHGRLGANRASGLAMLKPKLGFHQELSAARPRSSTQAELMKRRRASLPHATAPSRSSVRPRQRQAWRLAMKTTCGEP